MSNGHARLAPSGAHRWGPDRCPGSVAMEERYPEKEESEESREGTAAHFFLTEALAGRVLPIGTPASNGYSINAEMVEGAQGMIDDVTATRAAASPGLALRIEERVDAAVTVHPDNWGTPDVYLLDTPRRTLHVWDYKYGHRFVDARNNWQLINYAAAILESNGIDPADWPDWTLTFTIAQPRNYSPKGTVRESRMTGAVFLQMVQRLNAAAHAASQPDARLVTGDHCRDCRAATACPANQEAGFNAIDVSRRQIPHDLSPAVVGLELKLIDQALKRLNARKDALDATAQGLMRQGERVPWWRMGNVQSRAKWTATVDQVVTTAGMFGVEVRKPADLITPPQAIKAGLPAELVATLSEKPTGAVKLEYDDGSGADHVFGSAPV